MAGMQGPSFRRLAVALGFAAMVTMVLLLMRSGAHARTSRAAAIQRCANIQLTVTPFRGLGAATGHTGIWYRLHDLWKSPCGLQGYPGVELLDRRFRSIPITVTRGHGFITSGLTSRRVILSRKHDAYFALEFIDIPVVGVTCHAASYLLVIPPDDYLPVATYAVAGSHYFPSSLRACPGEMNISPVEPQAVLP